MNLIAKNNPPLAELTKTINETLPDIIQKSHFFRKDSQHSISFQSLTMLNGQHPMRVLRQISAEIVQRRNALLEASSKLVDLEENILNEANAIKKVILENQLIELRNAINNAVKDIGVLSTRYKQVEEKNGISEWGETEFEEAEASFHVRRGFELLYQNLIQLGRPEKSVIEYLQQYGIHPQVATREVGGYLTLVEQMIEKKEYPDSSHLEDFLDEMMNRYKDKTKDVSERLFGTRELVLNSSIIPTIEGATMLSSLDNNFGTGTSGKQLLKGVSKS